jgi:signal transduction histidine kinase/integral membrane sensor domain MASE1
MVGVGRRGCLDIARQLIDTRSLPASGEGEEKEPHALGTIALEQTPHDGARYRRRPVTAFTLLLDRVGLHRGSRLTAALATRTLLLAVFTATAYYVGMQVGFQTKFPGGGPSILWPPNAILLGVLLATTPSRWAVFLLAAFPVHVVTELRAGFPWPLLVGLFATNCGQALLGAVLTRRLLGTRIDFNNLRHVIVFIAAAAGFAPFVTSFVDVWMWVAAAWPEGIRYWPAWAVRFASNALTVLVVTPIVVLGINRSRNWFRRPMAGRLAEATMLVLGLAGAGLLIGISEPSHIPALMYTPLPLLLWAAVRFGPGGVSGSLFAITFCMTMGASRLLESLAERPDVAKTFSFQFFLVMVVTAVSLMLLAAVIREREKAEARTREQLAFERLLSEVAAGFADRPVERLDEAIRGTLERIVEFLDVDRATIARPAPDGSVLLATSVFRPGIDPPPGQFLNDEFPWSRERILRGQVVHFARLDHLPAEAAVDRAAYRRLGIRSAVMVPLAAGGTRIGVLGLSTIRTERTWPGGIVERIRLLGEILTVTVMRQRADRAAREGEILNQAVLASLTGAVAVLDRTGIILRVNGAWSRLARAHAGDLLPELLVGGNYLEACRRLAQLGIQEGQVALEGLQTLLAGTSRGFSIEYSWPWGAGSGWAEMLAVPLERPAGGAVITHHDITRRKQSELEAQQHRQSLAHAARVLAVGELAGSIGHELNQPLTAIVSNAQAAQRLLDRGSPDLVEMHEILGDIAKDGKRAGDVIRGLRALLKRSEAQPVAVDMTSVVGEVVALLRSDAITKSIAVRLDVSPALPMVTGDRVQLQQVVLNLFMNAYDAMAGAASPHELHVRMRPCPAGLELLVSDTGPVLPEDALERMFEPFFTTKPEGLGMGLSISRTIVRAHGGEIRADRNPERGVTMWVTLPGTDGRGPARP